MARPSVPVAGGKGGGGATTSVGKRNAGRQSHVVAASNGHGNTGNSGNKEQQESSNGETKQEQQQHSNKHQPHIEKSETVSKATGAAAATAQAVSKYHSLPSLVSYYRVTTKVERYSYFYWFLNSQHLRLQIKFEMEVVNLSIF